MALNNSQYASVMREYDRKQSQNREEQQRRRDQIYARCPELAGLDAETSTLAVRQARRLLEGDGEALERLREEYDRIRSRREALFEKAGLSPDCLDMRWDCKLCRDTGYVDGKKCRCFLQKELEILYHQSRIRERLQTENFESCTDRCYSDTEPAGKSGQTVRQYMRGVIAACKSFAANFDRDGGNLVLYGSTGVGKTFLAGCIARELIEQYHSVVYLSAADLFDVMAKERFHREDTPEGEGGVWSVLECDLLIIDDLGTELPNGFTNSQLFYCLNERLLRRKSTIITTNLTPGQLGREYSERIGSRLVENYRFLSLPQGDVRIWKQREQRKKHGGEK